MRKLGENRLRQTFLSSIDRPKVARSGAMADFPAMQRETISL